MSGNHIGAMSCAALGAIFLCMALIFALLREKGAMLISGFNTLSKRERSKYDQKKMSKDMRNALLLWCVILFIGAVLSYFFGFYFSMIAFAVWLVLFFREVKLDPEKAFAKYRL